MVVSKRLKLHVVLLPFSICMLSFLLACQPTPERDIVGNKSDGVLQAALDQGMEQAEQMQVPKSYAFSETYYDGKLDLVIDAAVEFPIEQIFPVYGARVAPLSQLQTENIVHTLFGADAAFTENNVFLRTKQEIIDYELIPTQEMLEAVLHGEKVGDDAGYYSAEGLQASITEITRRIAEAPETRAEPPISVKAYSTSYSGLYATGKLPGGEQALIWITNGMDDYPIWLRFETQGRHYDELIDSSLAESPVNLKISQAEAETIAKEMVQKMGVTDMEIAEVASTALMGGGEGSQDRSKRAYAITFTRIINGLQLIYNPTAIRQEYRAQVDAERIRVHVDNHGIADVYWLGNTEITDVRAENVQLMEFEEIMQRVQQQLFVEYNLWSNPDLDSSQFVHYLCSIDRIALSYYRILDKDAVNGFLLIPVWEFFGKTKLTYSEEIQSLYGEDVGITNYDT